MDLDDLIGDLLEDNVKSKARKETGKQQKKEDMFSWGDEEPPKLEKKSVSTVPKKQDDDLGWGQSETFGVK
jgi:hypothetical protein